MDQPGSGVGREGSKGSEKGPYIYNRKRRHVKKGTLLACSRRTLQTPPSPRLSHPDPLRTPMILKGLLRLSPFFGLSHAEPATV